MREFVVFYAWQSDRPARLNRHLIRFALNLAAKRISDDASVGIRVRIDADTEGVLGHVPVTDTILMKIAGCDAFVPDLTFVAATDSGKLIPNPNVMLEYGYALRAKSHAVMIPVLNTAYGPPEELPFDMGHLRFPLQYRLPAAATNAERRAVRQGLTEEFEQILRQMIAGAPAQPGTAFPEATAARPPAFFFPLEAVIAAFGHPGEQEYRFDGERAIYLRFFPKYGDGQPKPGRTAIRTLVHDRQLVKAMSPTIGGLSSANDFGWITIDPSGNTATKAISQVFPTGELWGINAQVFSTVPVRRTIASRDEWGVAIGVVSAEKLCARSLEKYAAAAAEMKLRPPFVVELGAVRLKGVYMGAPHPEFSSGHYYGPIREDKLVRRYELEDTQRPALFGVLRQFFDEFYDLAECSRRDLLTDEMVVANDIPSRG